MAIGRKVTGTGLEDATAIRDYAADRRAAIEAQIALVEKNGGDTTHLKRVLGKRGGKVTGHEHSAHVGVPQPMAPGQEPPTTALSPRPDTVREPEDGSAPDKRKQDQRPVGSTPAVVAADPGPEGVKANRLPDQVADDPKTAVVSPVAPVAPGDPNVPALPDQGPKRDPDADPDLVLEEKQVDEDTKVVAPTKAASHTKPVPGRKPTGR